MVIQSLMLHGLPECNYPTEPSASLTRETNNESGQEAPSLETARLNSLRILHGKSNPAQNLNASAGERVDRVLPAGTPVHHKSGPRRKFRGLETDSC